MMYRSWAVVFRVKKKSVAVQRLSFALSILLLLALGQVPATARPWQSKKPTRSSKSSARQRKLQHINKAFVASADLKPMAQQLLQNRTPQAYAGVEAYAHQHKADEAGPLAWLVLGYAHYLDNDFPKALTSWQQAKGVAPVLGDYLAYLNASAYQAQQKNSDVITTLSDFEQKYPDSLLIHDAGLMYARALTASGALQRAVAYLEKHRQPVHADFEFALAQAHQQAGEKDKAAEIFRHIYFELPLSPEADTAAFELRALGEMQPTGSFEDRRSRAELLLKGKRYQPAANDLSPLLEHAPSSALTELQVEFANALYRLHKRDDAQHLFEGIAQSAAAAPETKAQALYFLAEIAREKNDNDHRTELIVQLRTLAPESPWLQEALLSVANMYLIKKDYETAARFYSEIYQRQRNGRFSPYAHWKAAWLTYRLGKKDDAKRLFDEQLDFYPTSAEVPAAIYWRGRLAETDGDQPLARAYYSKLSEKYRYFYYANLGRDRLSKIGAENVADPPVLNKLSLPSAPPQKWEAPADNIRAQKAQLLANAALFDFAVKELQAAASGTPSWQAQATALIYADAGYYHRGIEALKRAVPNYFSANLNQLPRPVWQGLFPRPFWDELKKDSLQNALDPFLMASLIRQESEFNPAALSRANAFGLMQLLPKVGKGLAKEVKIKNFSTDVLFTPNVNLELGTRYFRHMVDHYNGQIEYALAAYNAGEERVDDWRKSGDFKDVEEFVESIPFTETREYVQAIMRNAVMYKLLYPKG
jgi:soluble lytic murein transglycosylase